MLLAGIILLGIGLIVIVIGCAFIVPYKNVKRFANNQVQGQIIDMVWNAAMYNEPLDKAANVEHIKIAGMEIKPGTRNPGVELGTTYVRVGDGQPDPKKVVIGQGPVNMFHKVYRYVVNGKEYTRADGVRYNRGMVEPLIGKTVTVYYNPDNPQQSTLSNGGGYKLTMTILYIVGGLIALLGITLLVFGALFSIFV